MSTQQILGVVGGVVGAFFGYPQLGFVVGSLVGGLLTPGEKTEGPRVDDLKVQVSTYGAGIPILYGTERIGGNVVWSTDKIETEDTQGGKGAEPEHTTYRYFVHMGIVLCETPRDGSVINIVQIFQDGKLIFDVHSGIPIGSALATSENPYAFFVLYQGYADQLPDPIEELYEDGPGSVPAYRGVVRIRMNAIECPGGRVPQFSFVLTTTPAVTTKTEFASTPSASGIAAADGLWSWTVSGTSSPVVSVSRSDAGGDAVFQRSVALGEYYANFYGPFAVNAADTPTAMFSFGLSDDDGTWNTVRLLNLETGHMSEIDRVPNAGAGTPIGAGERPHAAYDTVTEQYAVTRGYDASDIGLTIFPTLLECDASLLNPASPIAFYDGVVYGVNFVAGAATLVTIDASDGSTAAYPGGPSPVTPTVTGCAISVNANGIMVRLKGSVSHNYLVAISGASSVWTQFLGDSDYLSNSNESTRPSSAPAFFPNGAIVGPNIGGDWTYIQYATFNPAPVLVSGIISDICDRVSESRYDVSDIPATDTVMGYKLQNPASARANIDPLLTAFAIYIVDEDGVIKFKKYEDIVSEATVAYDELGQAEDGAEPADAMPLNRAQEIDMPRSVAVSYIEPSFDYQTASEKEVRRITEATEDLIVELPIATNSNHAKKVASMILFAKWRAQNTRSFKTSRKYAFLSPGDGVTVEYPRGTFRLWRITSMTDTGVLCEFNVEPGDAELYTQTAIGAAGYVGQQVAPLAPPTRLQLLDIPILRDVDNNAGLYAALAGYSSGYPGGELFVGDDDADLSSRGTVSLEAPIGSVETALGNCTIGVIDETNLLTVSMGHHVLGSITQAVLLSGTTNVAAVGAPGRWEIIKFQRADSLGSGRYILSGLLRGQRGTEWACGLHTSSDIIVVLATAGILRPNLEAGSIGQTKSYRAVTKGRGFNSAASQTYANTAEGLEPFSPTNLIKTQVGGDLVFSWVRRTRLSENWLNGIVPLGEASQAFLTVLYTGGTFETEMRVIASSTNESTYTAAMQAEDGYASGPLYVRVFQVSDVVGRGHALEATI